MISLWFQGYLAAEFPATAEYQWSASEAREEWLQCARWLRQEVGLQWLAEDELLWAAGCSKINANSIQGGEREVVSSSLERHWAWAGHWALMCCCLPARTRSSQFNPTQLETTSVHSTQFKPPDKAIVYLIAQKTVA